MLGKSASAAASTGEPCPEQGCSGLIAWNANACPVCLTTIAAPNVRLALREQSILEERYFRARETLTQKGADVIGQEYEQAVSRSNAIFACSLDYALQLADGRRWHQNYHAGVQSGARSATVESDDRVRLTVDAQILGSIAPRISMAALSLSPVGLPSYGELFVQIEERVCALRGTVLSENSYDLVKTRSGDPVSLLRGHRAVWRDRSRLALVRATKALQPSTTEAEFPALLLTAGSNRHEDRFMEVHIFEKWNIQAVHRMTVRSASLKTSLAKAQAEELADRLNARGLALDVVE